MVPPPSLGRELGTLLESGTATDIKFEVEEELMPAHKIILQVRGLLMVVGGLWVPGRAKAEI